MKNLRLFNILLLILSMTVSLISETRAQTQELSSDLISAVYNGMRLPNEDSTAMNIDYTVVLTDALEDFSKIIISVGDEGENEVYSESISLIRDNQQHIISIISGEHRYTVRKGKLTIPVFFTKPFEEAFSTFTLKVSTISRGGVSQVHFSERETNF